MNLKKLYLINLCWSKIREKRILREHKRIVSLCHNHINRLKESDFGFYSISPNTEISKPTIWQYWAQGYDHVPEMVQFCLDSVDRYHGGYQIVRISDANISDYLYIPEELGIKLSGLSKAAFSDIIRLCLLTFYGGVWLDATVYLSSSLNQMSDKEGYFLFQRDDNEEYKHYWEQSYAAYWGWGKDFSVRILSSIIFAEKNNPNISLWCQAVLSYVEQHCNWPHYFFLHLMFDTLVKEGKINNCKVINDVLPHQLWQTILDSKKYPIQTSQVIKDVSIHKFTYKIDEDSAKLIIRTLSKL